MNRIIRAQTVVILLGLLLGAQGLLSAQSLTASAFAGVKFRGVVKRPDGAKVGAAVTIEGDGLKHELRTGESGEFEDELPAGIYRITIEKPGYKKHLWEAYRVRGGARGPHEFMIQAAQAPDVHIIEPPD